jgi:hypothetical protein
MHNDNILLYLGFVFRSYQYDWYNFNHVYNDKLMSDLILSYNIFELGFIILALYFVIAWNYKK